MSLGNIMTGAMSFGITSLLRSAMAEVTLPNPTAAKLELTAINKDGLPISLMGLSTLVLQYNPENLTYPKVLAEYQEMGALGVRYPTLHYVGSKNEPIDIVFSMTDDVEGPPRSKNEGGDSWFFDLDQARLWLELLAEPLSIVERPPFVHLLFGNYSRVGLVKEIQAKAVKTYKNLIPRVVEVSFVFFPLDPRYLVETTVVNEASMKVE